MLSLSQTVARAGVWTQMRLFRAQATRDLVRLAIRSARGHGASPRWLLGRLARLRSEGYTMHPYLVAEAAMLGLLDPSAPPERWRDTVPAVRFRPLQLRLSPSPLSAVIDDKALFYTACNLAGLPVPETHAFVYRDEPGWTRDGRTPQTRGQWTAALAELLEGEVIAKPANGDMGEGVRAFRRDGDRFFEGGRPLGDASGVYDALLSDGRFDGFVLQRRVYNHELLASLGGSRTLQTTRVITLLEEGDVAVMFATQKIVAADTVTDNIHGGTSGNAHAAIDVEAGTLGPLVVPLPNGGIVEVDRHPRTERLCRGVQLPWWPETLALVRRGAAAFGMLRTLGWDVAITQDGPMLIEANSGWGPPNGLGSMWPLLTRLEAAVRREEERAVEKEPEQLLGAGRPE